MKTKYFVIGLLLFSLSLSTYSQQTGRPINKNINKSELDNLCQKYKGVNNITLNTTTEDLHGLVEIDYNKNKKPLSISIIGSTFNKTATAELVVNTIKIKLKQGYNFSYIPFKWQNGMDAIGRLEKEFKVPSENTKGEAITWAVKVIMQKGNMFFRADIGTEYYIAHPNYPEYHWGITTGDSSRKDKVDVKKKDDKKAFKLDF